MTRPTIAMSQVARGKAAERGHFVKIMIKMQPGKWRGICTKCGLEVYMLLMPKPGQQQYYGRALIDDCDG